MEEYGHDEQGRARIILPPQGLGKVIQIKIKEPEEGLFIGGDENKYHSLLLKDTLEKFNLGFDGKEVGPPLRRRFKPNVEGENYTLFNAGKTRREGNIIYVGEFSSDYVDEIGWFREEHLDKIIPFLPNEIKFIYQFNI